MHAVRHCCQYAVLLSAVAGIAVAQQTGSNGAPGTSSVHVGVRAAAIPTIAAGVGAGTAPGAVTIVAGSTDLSGTITIGTGTSPTAFGVVATITFNVPYTGTVPHCILYPVTTNAAQLGAGPVFLPLSAITLTGFNINSTTPALAASTTYSWEYICTQ
jgi:hypothetical protein